MVDGGILFFFWGPMQGCVDQNGYYSGKFWNVNVVEMGQMYFKYWSYQFKNLIWSYQFWNLI
jgi:hypothetical protein